MSRASGKASGRPDGASDQNKPCKKERRGMVLLTEIPLPRIARQGTIFLLVDKIEQLDFLNSTKFPKMSPPLPNQRGVYQRSFWVSLRTTYACPCPCPCACACACACVRVRVRVRLRVLVRVRVRVRMRLPSGRSPQAGPSSTRACGHVMYVYGRAVARTATYMMCCTAWEVSIGPI